MVNYIYAACLLLTLNIADAQFFDFFSALQPNQQTLRPIFQFDITTKKPKTQTKRIESTRRRTENTTRKTTPFLYSGEFVTPRKTKAPISTAKPRTEGKINEDNSNVNYNIVNNNGRDNNDRVNNKKVENANKHNEERLIFVDGKRNTIVNYGTTKSYEKNRYTTQRPIQDGIIPAVAIGPPITNKPSTRPSSGPVDIDDTLSPELKIGPDEDYMTIVEKKRHIEIAEQMCDRYKALDVERVEAIPLLPSPEPVAINVSTCPNEVALILGGKVATIQEFRHMVLLGWTRLLRRGYSWKCGGSLVSAQYVLTAAHCAYQDRDNNVVTGAPRVVQLGSSRMDDLEATIRKVASVIRHPKYKVSKSYYDIALVKMADTVKFSSVIKPACMGIPPPPGKHIIATGWGKTEYSEQSLELRKVSLAIWDIAECYTALGTSRKLPEGPSGDSQVCAGERSGGRDTCQGDSGGPAQIQEDCSWRVVAVTSLGRSCGAVDTPAVYATVPRAFVSAVVFKGKVENVEKQTNQLNTQSNNQKTNKQQNWNQPTNSQQPNKNQQTNNQQNWNQPSNSQQPNKNQQTNNQQNWNQPSNNQQTNNKQNWNQPSDSQQPSNNQQTNNQQNWNQPSRNPEIWNRNDESIRNPQHNNQDTNGQNRNTNNDRNTQSNNENRNKYNEYQTYNQNQRRNSNEDYNNRQNDDTSSRPGNNNGNGNYGDYSVVPSGYQSDYDRPYWT